MYFQCHRLLRWCPSPDCSSVIRVQHVESRPVTCRCNHTFCFACGNNWHEPVRCNLLRKWIKKCDDDSETSNWIAANTKVSYHITLLDLFVFNFVCCLSPSFLQFSFSANLLKILKCLCHLLIENCKEFQEKMNTSCNLFPSLQKKSF